MKKGGNQVVSLATVNTQRLQYVTSVSRKEINHSPNYMNEKCANCNGFIRDYTWAGSGGAIICNCPVLVTSKINYNPVNISYEMGVKDGKQQLLESLSEEIDGMYEKCPCGKFNCHGQGNDDALNEVKALIQSKKTELL